MMQATTLKLRLTFVPLKTVQGEPTAAYPAPVIADARSATEVADVAAGEGARATAPSRPPAGVPAPVVGLGAGVASDARARPPPLREATPTDVRGPATVRDRSPLTATGDVAGSAIAGQAVVAALLVADGVGPGERPDAAGDAATVRRQTAMGQVAAGTALPRVHEPKATVVA